MKIKLANQTVNYIPDDFKNNSHKTPLLFLHGFTGSSGDWKFLFDQLDESYTPLAIDMPGHGESSTPDIIDYFLEESIVDMISNVLSELNISSLVICGYSMGGRAALSYAIKYPDNVSGLILESSTPGIISEKDRSLRIDDDEKIAGRILETGMNNFIDEWYNKPLFNSIREKSELYGKLVEGKKINNPIGLANSLRGFSTGRMSNHWGNLKKLTMPVLLMTGENDEKFSKINNEMLKLLPIAEHNIVSSSGHIAHLENAEDFIILLNSFLSKI